MKSPLLQRSLVLFLFALFAFRGVHAQLTIHTEQDTVLKCYDDELWLSASASGGVAPYIWRWNGMEAAAPLLLEAGGLAGGEHVIAIEVEDAEGNRVIDSIRVLVLDECVWPGDTDQSGIADHLDLLALGLSFGHSGGERPNAHLQFVAQPAPAWAYTHNNGVNFVHADVDGNGIVEAEDVEGIRINYQEPTLYQQISGASIDAPELIVALPEEMSSGDTLVTKVSLGTDNFPASEVYGIAFTIEYESALLNTTENALWVDYSSSWLGQEGEDLLTLDRHFSELRRIDVALTRTDLEARGGFGTLAEIIIVLEDIVAKKNLVETLDIRITGVQMINKEGELLSVSTRESSGVIVLSDEEDLPFQSNLLNLYPNPATQFIELAWQNQPIQALALYDVTGRIHQKYVNLQQSSFRLDISALEPGLYFITVNSKGQKITRNLLITR